MKKFIIAILLMLVLACGCASAAVPDPTDDFYVLDKANVLDTDTEGMIVFSNDLLFEDCGAQVVVVAVKSLGGEDISDYAYDLYNDWQIGNKDGEGFLLLMAIEEENYFLLTGEGLDTEFTGGTLRKIMNDYLEPDFAAGDYDAGVDKTFRKVFEMVADACGSNATVEEGIKLYEAYMASGDEPAVENNFSAPIGNQVGSRPADDYSVSEPVRQGRGFPSVGTIILIIVLILIIVALVKRSRRRRVNPGVSFFPRITLPRVRRTPAPPPPPPARGHMHSYSPIIFGGPARAPHVHSAPRPRAAQRPTGKPHTYSSAPRTGSFGGSRIGSFGSSASRSSASRSSVSRSSASRSSFGGSRSSASRSGFGGGRSGGGGRSRGGGGGRGR